MPRKKLTCDLPPLRRPSAMRNRELSDANLLKIFRDVAIAHRRSEPEQFYPLRNAAKELKVPISAISRTYDKLKKEGLLTTMRGSRTVLQGRQSGRRLHIKSFLGLPVSYTCFMTLQDYRRFCLELKREAHLRGFGFTLLFYEDNPLGLDQLSEIVESSGVDSIIWFVPGISIRQTVLALRDKGVRVFGVSDGGSPGIACRYEINREKAVSAILNQWHSAGGIQSVTVVRISKRSPADEEMIEHAARRAGLSCRFQHIQDDAIQDQIASLCEDRHAGIVLPAAPAALFSLRSPPALARLLKSSRILFPDGPITSLWGAAPMLPVDLVTVNWRSVTNKIVGDIARKRAFDESRTTVFHATPHYQVALSRYAEAF
jgi:DNA-binding transcriptional ArsR family regulator